MHSRFIKLYDDNGYEYIVNMNEIVCVDVAGKIRLRRVSEVLRGRVQGDGREL